MSKLVESHRKFTVLGVVLLVITIVINYYHQSNHLDTGINYAYVTGIAMVIVFMISFVKFNYEKLKKPKQRK